MRLTLGIVLGSCLLLAPAVPAAAPPRDGGSAKAGPRPYFVHLSDTHVAQDPAAQIYGQVPNANTAKAVAMIGKLSPPPREVIVTGDLACDKGIEEEYQQYVALMSPLAAAGLVLRHLIGNHDSYVPFRKIVLLDKEGPPPGGWPPPAYKYAWDWDKDWHFLAISSLRGGQSVGEVGKPQMEWIEQEATAAKDRNVAVFLHHHPFRTDNEGIVDHDTMKTALQRHPNIRAVFFGHMHVLSLTQEGPLHLICAPSCSYGAVPGNRDALGFFVVTPEPAAFTVKYVPLDEKQPVQPFEKRLTW